jgi:hypothetical protein
MVARLWIKLDSPSYADVAEGVDEALVSEDAVRSHMALLSPSLHEKTPTGELAGRGIMSCGSRRFSSLWLPHLRYPTWWSFSCTDSAGHAPVLRYPRANRQRPCAGAILSRACRVLRSGSIRLCRSKSVELPPLLGKIRALGARRER